MTGGLRSNWDEELKRLKKDLLEMAADVDRAILLCMQALLHRDAGIARRVIAGDAQINRRRFRLEEACAGAIATQQPTASDLRLILATMSIATDLERMADHAAGVAKIVLRMEDEPLPKPLIDLPRMAEKAREMLRRSLQAFAAGDVALARAVASEDDQIDQLYQQIFRELLAFMLEDPATTTRALYLLFAGHNLERIADRATNIAERVIFLRSGELRELNPEPQSDMN
jgi:phosphate transport system protein